MKEIKFLESESNRYKIFYTSEDCGGGTTFGYDFIPMLQSRYPDKKFESCLEWCSGNGVIGFNLLANEICEKLWLFDKDQSALNIAASTIGYNHLEDRVKIICEDTIANLSSENTFDLIVANPPHWNHTPYNTRGMLSRLYLDKKWKIHNDFFNNIKKNLKPEGVILLQESVWASSPEMFTSIINKNNLYINDNFVIPNSIDPFYQTYFIEIKHNLLHKILRR